MRDVTHIVGDILKVVFLAMLPVILILAIILLYNYMWPSTQMNTQQHSSVSLQYGAMSYSTMTDDRTNA